MHPESLRTDALDYDLPDALIARRPVEPREDARLMIVPLNEDRIVHARVRDLPGVVRPDDAIVVNTTSVLPARLHGVRSDSGGRIEGLFVDAPEPGVWRLMLRSNGRLRLNAPLTFRHGSTSLNGTIIDRDGALWTVRVNDDRDAAVVLDGIGATPLPPYIRRARAADGETIDDAHDRRWYQTVFADARQAGSVAAPTAGLHLTSTLLDGLSHIGVHRHDVVLHVGPGTFKPVEASTLDQHVMHRESYEVPPETLQRLVDRQTGAWSGRVIAIGTTSVRTLESLPRVPDARAAIRGSTDLLIAPPYTPIHVDGLLTNFHLPRSTLLALVAAFIGLDRVLACYREAVERGYRFYSYGDAMLIVPSL